MKSVTQMILSCCLLTTLLVQRSLLIQLPANKANAWNFQGQVVSFKFQGEYPLPSSFVSTFLESEPPAEFDERNFFHFWLTCKDQQTQGSCDPRDCMV